MIELTSVSLFSGAGGLDLGLESVGFNTVFASDIDPHSCRTLAAGRETTKDMEKPFLQRAAIEQKDVAELTGRQILADVGQVDLLAGGPPCQAFSVFGKRRGLQDPRAQPVYEYLRLLGELRPNSFLFENVYGILTIGEGRVFQELLDRFSNPGSGLHYALSVHRLNAVNYGVPQFRDRVFVFGHREGKTIDEIPPITSASGPNLFVKGWRTVRDGLRGLPLSPQEPPPNHVGRDHSQRIIDRYASLSPGERDPKTRINKLDLDRPSFTIIVGSDKGGGKGHVHPIDPREVTPRESARMQCFPDWWGFSGARRHVIRQVGNAVPTLLAAAIGNEIKHRFFGIDKTSHDEYVLALDQQHLF